ncbi:putative DNA directed RNA polymerase III subunit Rpc82 [Talaromyces proteolyticus]|uniref:DNA-directed RNA polymerase III subunit RPC3 n=1 Tax=Talaromyces proteolyticus TaxID=1131652 RepID=A0AAD4KLU0_9EURO|nr:putative DNA directed RNA polymerase III subunit Rpc82 [Talaromyces proteolyticus]KAH8691125.1 putative DNA directed RNA polymerase III subunit Rpc82 [Talaromyces proteolyticus]
MIQMQLVYHFTSTDDGITHYEASINAAYYLIRSGKMLEIVEERLGAYAAKVMSAIMYRGHAQISYLEAMAELRTKGVGKSSTNGGTFDWDENEGQNGDAPHSPSSEKTVTGDQSSDHTRLHTILKSLAGHGFINRVKDAHFHSIMDNTLDAERKARRDLETTEFKGKKLEVEVEIRMEKILKEQLNSDLTQDYPLGTKRPQVNGYSGGSRKRRRLDSSGGYSEDEDSEHEDDDEDQRPIDSNLVVRVNYEKLDVVLRNRRLVELAAQGTSPVTAQLYETLLRVIEYKTYRCREGGAEIPREGEEFETGTEPVTVQRLISEVDPDLDLSGSLGPSGNPPAGKKIKRPLENGVNGDHHDDDDDDDDENITTETTKSYDINQHLSLLALPPYRLVRRSNSSIPAWTVEFRRLARQLRHLEIERIVGIRFGRLALRVLRILLEKGKLDEKRLQEISLISQKDLRQVLAHMQESGFVDLQEIPKDSQRLPSKTVFLWFFDPDRVGRNLLHDTYKAMSCCLQRLRFERGRLKDFLDKTERIDVKGNEEQYLSEAELQVLQEWRDKEALMLGEVARLDDLVAVLRDF